jgi:hypothetical protein
MFALKQLDRGGPDFLVFACPAQRDAPVAPQVKRQGKHLDLADELLPFACSRIGRASDDHHQSRAKLGRRVTVIAEYSLQLPKALSSTSLYPDDRTGLASRMRSAPNFHRHPLTGSENRHPHPSLRVRWRGPVTPTEPTGPLPVFRQTEVVMLDQTARIQA